VGTHKFDCSEAQRDRTFSTKSVYESARIVSYS